MSDPEKKKSIFDTGYLPYPTVLYVYRSYELSVKGARSSAGKDTFDRHAGPQPLEPDTVR